LLLDSIKKSLRITHGALNDEIEDVIDAARSDLKLSGISSVKADAETDIDPLIKRAITVYVKANFGSDNPDADRLQKSYDLLKNHLTLAGDYIGTGDVIE
jgi:uncharacterized phage protein (predicted DNA packaging)